jgi:outer membrane protein OmpA-like peptidoglycan-associated protein
MAESTLSFVSTSSFRNSLMVKNLAPYNVPGAYTPPSGALNYEITQTVSNVIDSPDTLIHDDPYAQILYPLNEYGPNGGYNLNITYNNPPLPVESNQGEYNPTETALDLVNEFFIDASFIENRYGPEGGFKDMVVIDSIQNNDKLYLPYFTFTPSFYSPFEILISNSPIGSNGPLSNDSYLAKLGAQSLRAAFEERVAIEIYQNTVGAVNLQALQDPFEISLLLSGQQPLIYKNWKITVPENPILAAVDLATRLAGAYWPVSPIPGNYFNENEINGGQSMQTSTALNVVNQLTGGFLGPILNKTRNPSQIFLANTGNGQRSALFANINYNRYQPGYDKSYGGLLGVGQAIVNLAVNLINPSNGTLVGGYYVGSKNAEPSTITSPPNQIPVNPFGKQVQTPVYGPSELGILYEGNETKLNFGLGGKSSSDGGSIDGQFIWVSPKYKDNAGFRATPGGGSGKLDQEFTEIKSSYEKGESTNVTFKESSILDQTQRIIDSADNVTGISRLKHVGNAMNQVSKVFHDGYKEITKGSQVVSYTDNTTGGEVGIEYCRVFTKDTPYYTYNDLQKVDGITKSGRQFTNSVFDNTFNLNIAPTSTNIVGGDENGRGSYAKKYMFSIENLAWRTSSRPGFTYDELPVCEKGPNGGRVMWFPPYDIKFNESSNIAYPGTEFLGRPEPIYTYKSTTRTGTLSWKIIVDHPSVMNVVAEKQLKNQSPEKVNSVMDSFFAGCVKFDIYELAKKYNTIPAADLFTYQQILNDPRLTNEEWAGINMSMSKVNTDTTGNNANTNTSKAITEDTSGAEFENKYLDFAFYFDNDIPKVSTPIDNYQSLYNKYIDGSNKTKYESNANSTFNSDSKDRNVLGFFTTVVESNFNTFSKGFVKDAFNLLTNNPEAKITVVMEGSASASASVDYNKALSNRRITSILNFLDIYKDGDASLKPFIENQRFKITTEPGTGEETVIPKAYTERASGTTQSTTSKTTPGFDVDCKVNQPDKNGNVTVNSQTFSVSAMACRRVRVKTINVMIPPKPVAPVNSTKNIKEVKTVNGNVTINVPKPVATVDTIKKIKEGITKKVLRKLLSECDYFKVIEKEVPMIYNSIKEKIKYFNPAFHSTTPEGLNARLTFLNQCVRPGETIPTIGTDGKPKYNDAVNTSFGAPPVLVLRLGDFVNSKIIPTALAFTYDPLVFDMNPEGIGIQPMIATVTLNFNIIGGMGLAGPVEQLQNALSFNYYANTEIYDERSVWTEDTSALDKTVVDSILASQKLATVEDVDNPMTNNGGTTIGEIITNIPVTGGQTGEIGYQKIMDSLLTDTKTYFEAVTNQMQKLTLNSNFGIEQLVNDSRQYNVGTISLGADVEVEIYGKPEGVEKRLDDLFKMVIDDINTDTGIPNPIIDELLKKFDINSSAIRGVRKNMVDYITNLSSIFASEITTITQELTIQQQTYIQNIRKLNLISSNTDGKILDTGIPRIYNISGTDQISNSSIPPPGDTYEEFINDYDSLALTLTEYRDLLNENIIVSEDSLYNGGDFTAVNETLFTIGEEDKRFFLVISRIFNNPNKIEEFKKSVIKGDLVNIQDPVKLQTKFNNIVDDIAKRYSKEIKEEEKKFEKFKSGSDYKSFTDGIENKMYPKGKTRKFEYTTVVNTTTESTQKTDISNLYKTVNVPPLDKNTFNGKIKFD